MTCRICHNETDNKAHSFREMMFGLRESFDYIECKACKAIQIKEVPKDMARHYPKNYYSLDFDPTAFYKNPIRAYIENARITYAVFGTGLLGKTLYRKFPDTAPVSVGGVENISKESKILDVGCGSGRLLYQLRQIGFKNTSGTDPYLSEPITYNNGLSIETKELSEVEGTYDIIMMHHVFEHIADPEAMLDAVKSKLTDDGTCIIRIPVANSEAWEKYGPDWVQLDAPRHFFLHTLQSMDILAERAGLVVDEVNFDSRDFQFWGSEQYKRDIPLMNDRSLAMNLKSDLFTDEERQKWKEAADVLNSQARGDQAIFYLRKV